MSLEKAELNKLLLITGPFLTHRVISDYTPPQIGFKLNRTQWKALMILAGKENTNMSELSQYMNMEKGSVTSVVDGLIANGLLTRVSDKNDRRKICLALTKKSRPIADQARSLLDKHVMQKLDRLDDRDKTLLHESLKTILTIAEKL